MTHQAASGASSLFIRLFNGKNFEFESPCIEPIHVESVAHSAAQLPRFCGHQREFVSVAEHSVLVSRVLEDELQRRDLAFEGLLHDFHEPLSGGDIPRPFKRSRFFAGANELEAQVASRVRAWFALPEKLTPLVHQADLMVFAAEVQQNMNGPQEDFHCPYPSAQIKLRFLDWKQAKKAFLLRFYELSPPNLDGLMMAFAASDRLRSYRKESFTSFTRWFPDTAEWAMLLGWAEADPLRAQREAIEWIKGLKRNNADPELVEAIGASLCMVARLMDWRSLTMPFLDHVQSTFVQSSTAYQARVYAEGL